MNYTWIRFSGCGADVGRLAAWPCRIASFASGRSYVAAAMVVATLALGGCAVGPDFVRPSAPKVATYTAHPVTTTVATPGIDGGAAQHFMRGADIPGDWWTLFHSTALDDLVEQSLAHNADLQAAQAALRLAQENLRAQRGAYYPAVSADFSATRQMQSQQVAPAPNFPVVPNEYLYSFFTPQVSVVYALDVFGLNRRTVESLQAQAQSARFQMLAAQVTLSTNVVAAAVQQAALQAQVDATGQLVDIGQRMLRILRYQHAKGYASQLDVSAQEAQTAQLVASLPPLRKQLAAQQHLLAVLSGQLPGAAPGQRFTLAHLELPRDLPLSLPSTLVAQRPDVRQAEANLHAASAQIGIAVAERLPNITLTANAGSTAVALGQVFKSGTGFWGLGVDLAAPIFAGGRLLHQQRAAQAAYAQAAAQYRSTVLGAFQNVADTLVALDEDAQGLQAAALAAAAAKRTLDLSQRQVQDGYTNTLALLGAEQAYQQAQISLVQAQADRYLDTAALFQALGGGWWHEADAGHFTPQPATAGPKGAGPVDAAPVGNRMQAGSQP